MRRLTGSAQYGRDREKHGRAMLPHPWHRMNMWFYYRPSKCCRRLLDSNYVIGTLTKKQPSGVEEIITVGGCEVVLLGKKNYRKMRVKIHYAKMAWADPECRTVYFWGTISNLTFLSCLSHPPATLYKFYWVPEASASLVKSSTKVKKKTTPHL